MSDTVKVVSLNALLKELLKVLGQDRRWSTTVLVELLQHAVGQVHLIVEQRVLKHACLDVGTSLNTILSHALKHILVLVQE